MSSAVPSVAAAAAPSVAAAATSTPDAATAAATGDASARSSASSGAPSVTVTSGQSSISVARLTAGVPGDHKSAPVDPPSQTSASTRPNGNTDVKDSSPPGSRAPVAPRWASWKIAALVAGLAVVVTGILISTLYEPARKWWAGLST